MRSAFASSARRTTSIFRDEPGVVDSRAPSAHEPGLGRQQRGCERACGSRVADPELTDRDQAETGALELVGQIDPGGDAVLCLVPTHRGPTGRVRGSGAETKRADRVAVHGFARARVDDDQLRFGLPREDVDRCSSRRDIRQHLHRDLGRVGAYLLVGIAVISGRKDDRRAQRFEVRGAPGRGDANDESLELA